MDDADFGIRGLTGVDGHKSGRDDGAAELGGHVGERRGGLGEIPGLAFAPVGGVRYVWAFVSLTRSPGARAHYDRRRQAGDRHVAAQRNLFNRFMGMLFHCLQNGQVYDETTAFPNQQSAQLSAEAA
ncbi:hypothetical protein [Streptomyces sp. NPDC019890]|uniref:hypothetical protein n=1 Tax=Streptomyces sp. NPDC019890 TaxID=3365064 RepID=UPI00384AF36C